MSLLLRQKNQRGDDVRGHRSEEPSRRGSARGPRPDLKGGSSAAHALFPGQPNATPSAERATRDFGVTEFMGGEMRPLSGTYGHVGPRCSQSSGLASAFQGPFFFFSRIFVIQVIKCTRKAHWLISPSTAPLNRIDDRHRDPARHGFRERK